VETEEENPVAGLTEEEIATIRELIVQANPDAVPELIGGTNLAELTASVEGAKAAYTRIVARQPAAPPVVPAGGGTVAIDSDRLPTSEKIRRGLKQSAGHR
jgi:hypothetical protein